MVLKLLLLIKYIKNNNVFIYWNSGDNTVNNVRHELTSIVESITKEIKYLNSIFLSKLEKSRAKINYIRGRENRQQMLTMKYIQYYIYYM